MARSTRSRAGFASPGRAGAAIAAASRRIAISNFCIDRNPRIRLADEERRARLGAILARKSGLRPAATPACVTPYLVGLDREATMNGEKCLTCFLQGVHSVPAKQLAAPPASRGSAA